MALEIRKFELRIGMVNGEHFDIVRECQRAIPPSQQWIIEDFDSFVNAGRMIFCTRKDGRPMVLYTDKICSIELISETGGVDLLGIRKEYRK